ncbi:DNA polymerase III subunit gamma/tau, partial [Psychrobacter sp. UBA5136]|uniref:DNA polymerase III subunit gamma/tau n=1 Tax=Psychrobacter sp. UBA5136 TaxID=1947356 RepID=UPI0025DC8C74
MTQQYQVLARKYRPKNFHELIGQSHVSQALINAIDYNRLHHAYLFTGTRGVGKTTIARILSKCLNCETGITSTPCGVCDNCVAIDQGRFIDLIEIDAASRTKVEDTRELLDNVPYAPSQGRYKVYLIDEVHMLSTHSFNALLKTLEEPPEHVKFLLATTDPQKLPITIISRCLQFVLRPLSQSLLSEHLANILTQEQVDYTQPALWQLASAAKGSVRDALSLTDQAIAFGQGALDDVTVNAMLGLIDAADLVRLITDIYNHDKSAVAAHIEKMRAQMVDATSMFDGLAELLHQLALTQLLPEVALNVNEAQAQQIHQLAQHMSPDVLQLYYEIVVQAREGVKLASTPMQALEMCILRLLAFRPLPVDEVLVNLPDSTAPSSTTPLIEKNTSTTNTTESHTAPSNTVEHSSSLSTVEPLPVAEPHGAVYDNAELGQYGSHSHNHSHNHDEALSLIEDSNISLSSEPVVEP